MYSDSAESHSGEQKINWTQNANTVWFNLNEKKKQAKLICVDRGQNSGYPWSPGGYPRTKSEQKGTF